ncbi:hypothetical protein H4R35_002496, partial [Dimargaris xerosporica]
SHRNVAPMGVIGEVFIGGPGVSPGYVNRPDLNTTKFIANPFGRGTLYATGDLGRWLSNGEVECLGRMDDQVKVRGYRIELSEIRSALLTTGAVQNAAVLVLQKQLVAFVSPDSIDTLHLHDALAQQLPHYMVPSHVVAVSSIPLTFNGKVDQHALKQAFDQQMTTVRECNVPAATETTPHTQALQQVLGAILDLDPSAVNLASSFVQLGGDSISAIQLASRLRALGYTLPIPFILRRTPLHQLSEAMVPVLPPAASPAEACHSQGSFLFPLLDLPPADMERLERELAHRSLAADMMQTVYPLLPNLRGMLVATAKQASDYTNQFAVSVSGLSSIAQLQQAVDEVVGRHEALRSRFLLTWSAESVNGLQVVLNSSVPIDWTHANEWTELGALDERSYLAHSEARGIDVDGTMLRFTAVGAPPGDVRLIMTVHHAVLDGWSYGLVLHELRQLLSPPVIQRELAAPVSLGDFIAGRTTHDVQSDQAYWRSYLQGVDSCTLLDLPKPLAVEVAPAVHNQVLYADLSHLQALAQQHELTVHCLLIATWALVLRMHTGQDDVVFGNTVSGRAVDVAQVDRLVGCLVNVVPFRTRITPGQSVLNLLQSIRDGLVAMVTYEHCHLSEIQQWAALDHPVANLFNTLLAFESFPFDVDASTTPGVRLHSLDMQGQDDYDCTAAIEPHGTELRLTLTWNPSRFDATYAKLLASNVKSCLVGLVDSLASGGGHQCTIADLSIVHSTDQEQVIGFSRGSTAASSDRLVLDMFQATVECTPDAVAIEHGNVAWTYQQLLAHSQAIAQGLVDQGVSPEEPTGILVQRVPATIAALFGVLIAGAAFVPIDPTYPMDRIAYILNDCGIKHVLYHAEDTAVAAAVRQHTQCTTHAFDELLQSHSPADVVALPLSTIQPNHLAYILYTSGSTGQPKGVMIEHHSLATLVQQVSECTTIQPGSRHLQMLALTFDSALGDIFFTLCHGATLVLHQGIVESLHHVESTITTPSLLSMLDPTQYPNLTSITIIGEVLPDQLAKQWLSTCQVINVYGPTECTVIATSHVCTADTSVTIGQPISNYEVYILDSNLCLVPVGVVGELYIGGAGVMRGYVNRPDLDQAVLVPHPFQKQGQLYKTGDRGRWLVNGDIEYIGRNDGQIKVRGRRVESSEIEAVLCQHPEVTKAAIVVVDNQLVAFISPAAVNTAKVLSFATQRLPTYMVPVHALTLATLPLTTSGKINRKQLRQQAEHYQQSLCSAPQSVTKPCNPTERTVVEAMAQALSKAADTIDINDSFFGLGGDSLLAIKVVSLCREQGLCITVADVFRHATPSTLAESCRLPKLDRLHASFELPSTIEPYALLGLDDTALEGLRLEAAHQLNTSVDNVTDILPTSSLQDGFIVNTLKDPSAYMVQASFCITGPLDVAHYHECWQQVDQRHSILRTKFITTDTVPGHTALQVVLSAMDMAWSYRSCDQLPDKSFDQQIFAQDRHQGFAFDGRPLVRIALFKVADTDHRLFFSFHHALLDAWSMNIVLDEVMALYHGQSLEPVVQFNCYLGHLTQQPTDVTQRFWQGLLHEAIPTPDLQLPSTRAPLREPMTQHYATHHRQLVCPLSDINAFCQRLGITTNNLLRGLWALLLSRYLNASAEVTFGAMVSGRNVSLPGIDGMAGLCINTVPFRTQLDHQQPLHDWLRHLHQLSGSIMAYEHASLVDIQRWANVSADMPLFQSLLVFDKYRESQLNPDTHQVQCQATGGLNFTEYPLTASFTMDQDSMQLSLEYDTAKYDSAYILLLGNFIDHCLTQIVQSSTDTTLTEAMRLPEPELATITAWSQGSIRIFDPIVKYLDGMFTHHLPDYASHPALESGGQSWTYWEVQMQAYELAHRLQQHGIAHQTPVVLLFTRSPAYIVAMLAVLYLGAMYVPVEAKSGIKRIQDIVNELANSPIVTESQHLPLVDSLQLGQQPVIAVDIAAPESIAHTEVPSLSYQRSPTDLAYIIFTSGTTNKPKGVMVRHESAMNILQYIAHTLKLDEHCRFLQVLNLAFDGCLIELFSTFAVGGTVVLAQDDIAHSLAQVNTCHLMPSLLAAFDPADYPNLTTVISGGEPLPWVLGKQWAQHCQLLNVYGPTETTIICHAGLFDPEEAVSIGRPIANVQCHIVDAEFQPVPVGVQGQVCIAGVGVSSGYLNQPELTTRSFIDNPFGLGKLYLTGDLGCWLPNGKVKIFGRQDHQVKLRGFRIELGEIEAAAQSVPGINASAALVHGQRLVLFVSPAAVIISELQPVLRQKLPAYMVPHRIVTLDQLPVTTIGKVDRRALSELAPPAWTETTVTHSIVPNSILGQLIACIASVLSMPNHAIDPTLSFFSVGGDSISAIRLMMQCTKRGWSVAVPDVFSATSITDLAQIIETRQPIPSVDAMAAPSLIPFTATEQWYLRTYHQRPQGVWASAVACLSSDATLESLKHWIVDLAHTRESLNRQLDMAHNAWRQLPQVTPDTLGSMATVQLCNGCTTLDQVLERVEQEKSQLQSDTSPLMHLSLFALDNDVKVLALTAHQLLVDPHEWPSILRSLGQAFSSNALRLPTPSHSISIHLPLAQRTLSAPSVQPLLDFASSQAQPQYLDAVALGCLAYAWKTHCPHTALEVLHEQNQQGLRHVNRHCTIKSCIPVPASDTLSLAQMIDLAKQVVYGQLSTDVPSDDTSLTENHSDASVLYHAVAGASAHLAKQRLSPLLTLPYHSTFGHAEGYAYEAMAAVSDGGLALMVTGSRAQTTESMPHTLLGAWQQALVQYQASILGTLDALSVSDYPLLPIDNAQFPTLVHEVKATLNLTDYSIANLLPTSSLQDGFIISTLKDPSAYMVQMAFHIDGPLDADRYRQCWCDVGQRHSILRTKFVTIDFVSGHSAVQVVLPSMDIAWSYETDHQLLTGGRESQYLVQDRQHGFAFDGSPLLRLALFKVNDTDHLLIFTHHHALLDGWSLNIVLDEVMALYHNQTLAPVVQYSSYLGHLTQQPTDVTQRFWQGLLHEAIPTPDLQLPSTRPPLQPTTTEPYATHNHTLQCPLSNIHAFCQSLGITLNNLLRGLWALLLHRYLSEFDEVTFGALVSGRNVPVPGIDDMVGLCINTVPFRAKFNREQPLHDWLRDIHRVSGEIMAHEHANLVHIQQWANIPTDTPLFQSLLMYDKYRQSQNEIDEQVIRMRPSGGLNVTEYPLTAGFYDHENELCVALVYKTDSYDNAYVTLLGAYLDACLSRMIESTPDVLLGHVQRLPESEHKMIMGWSQGMAKTLDPAYTLLPDLFMTSLARCPRAIALESGDDQWTYAQVHQQALVIAQWLVAHQVQPGDRVALVFKRSPYFIFAILAVLLVGAAYVPIEATIASERLCGILTDLERPVVLLECYDEALVEHLTLVTRKLGYCDTMASNSARRPYNGSLIRQHPQDLAYIIFTSGTTGKPKGVQVRHESVVNTLLHQAHAMKLDSNCRFLQLLNIAFDASLSEIFPTIYIGGTIVLSQDNLVNDLRRVNTCVLTPSLLATLDSQDYPNLQTVVSGGEALGWALACDWAKDRQLFNGYGPTEVTIGSHFDLVCSDECIALSGLIANTQCYLLDQQQRPVPIGTPGEICIAGLGVSNGYLNQPELTAKAFIDNPFGSGKLYFTGDLGCWLPNGKIKCLGRKDHQVKLRGFRIELGEIESTAQTLDAVSACAAVVKSQQLVLYVTPASVDQTALRRLLAAKLPAYMLPTHIVGLDQLPLTPVGKVDRKALVGRDLSVAVESAEHVTVCPASALGQLLACVSGVLSVPLQSLDPLQSFFALGGDSISAIRLTVRCTKRGWLISVPDIFRATSIAELAKVIETRQPELATVTQSAQPALVRLTDSEQWWLDVGMQWPRGPWTIAALAVPQGSTRDNLARWAHTLLQSSEFLCRRLNLAEEGWLLLPCPSFDKLDSIITLQSYYDFSTHDQALEHVDQVIATLSSDEGPLLRLSLYVMKDGPSLLVVTAHCLLLHASQWPAVLQSLLHTIGSDVGQVTEIPMIREYASKLRPNAMTVTRDIPATTLQPLLDVALLHPQGQHLDAVLLGCLGYAYGSQCHQPTIDIAGNGPQPRLLRFEPCATKLALVDAVNLAKELLYSQQSTSPDLCSHEPLQPLGKTESLLYHAVTGASALMCNQLKSCLVISPFGDMLGRVTSAGSYRWEAMALSITNGLRLAIVGNSAIDSREALTALVAAWARALQQYATIVFGTLDTLTPLDYPLLSLDQTQLHELACEIKAALKLDNWSVIDVLPTSSLQDGFIVSTLKDPSAYMVQSTFCITGRLDVEHYHQCWQEVGQRHSILRTKFITTDLVPGHSALQVVLPSMAMAWSYVAQLQSLDDGFIEQYLAQDRRHGFALDGNPLIRIALFKVSDTEHQLFLTYHHALLDAWSMRIVLHEVMALYHKQPLQPVVQYQAYIAHLTRQPVEATQSFWQELLHDVKPTPDLQLPRVHTATLSSTAPEYHSYQQVLSCALSEIHAFCRSMGITTNNLLRGLWALALGRYLGNSKDVTFGVMVSGRNVPIGGIDDMVGLCINTVPFRAKLSGQQSLQDWLRDIHRVSGNIMAHEHASLVTIQKWANVTTDTPLFQSLLVFDKYPSEPAATIEQSIQCHHRGGVNFTEYPLTVSFDDANDQLQLALTYQTNIYNAEYVELISAFLDSCLTRIIQSSTDTTLTEAMRLPEPELATITAWSQGTTATYGSECTLLHDAFLHNLAARPDAVALESNGKQWTYAQVHQQALTITYWLLEHKLAPSSPVALIFTRSPEYVFAVLAVLLVGGIYVPIDAKASTNRIGDILNDLESPLILSNSLHVALLRDLECDFSQVGLCDDIIQSTSNHSAMPPYPRACSDSLAYIIYTSGTTGKPKGVMVQHQSVVNTLHHTASLLKLASDTRCLQVLNIAFDVCVAEVFATFLAGGTVVLSTTELLHDLSLVNTCYLTCSLLSAVDPMDYPNLTTVVSTGEALTSRVGQQWSTGRAFFNFYGPTEAAIFSHSTAHDGTQTVHIGQPIPNTQTYIVDEQLQLVPIGVHGQVCIAGAGVGNGYWGQPDLTSKAFIDNPFGPGKLYLTGDLGCWLPNGNVKVFGRQDHQVKLRGFRIELDEVANTLAKFEGVQQACVMVQDSQLVGYMAPKGADTQAIITFVKSELPRYMVPAAIVPLDALPLTSSGKVDRKVLPKHTFASQSTDASAIPRTPMEDCLIHLLAQVLHIAQETISPHNTFFDVGGDSLSAIRLVTLCRRQGLMLTMMDINRSNTIAQLAVLMESKEAPLSVVELYPTISDPVQLTPIQREFFGMNFQWPQAFQSPMLLECPTMHPHQTWARVINQVIAYHDMLRFHIPGHASGGPTIGIVEPTLALDSMFQFVDATNESDLHAIVAEACARIDYHQGPICQFRTINHNERQYLFFVAHHLVTDLVTLSIVAGDLELLLRDQPLPAKTMSYQAWSNKLHTIAGTLDVNTIMLPDPAPPLPLDYPNIPLNRTKEHAQTELVAIDGQLLQHFNQFTRQNGVAPVELLMAALVWAYEQCFHQPKVTMLFESHGRNIPGHDCDVTHTLGWFVGHHYLTLAKEHQQLPSDVLAHTQSLLRDLPVNGFNLFLAKHLKHFDTPAEKARFDIWPQVAFSFSTSQVPTPALEQPCFNRRNEMANCLASQSQHKAGTDHKGVHGAEAGLLEEE